MAVEEVSGPTYNTDKGERFRLPGDPGNDEYWVKVDKDTGNVQIFQSQPGIILDKEVGTMNPKTGEIDIIINGVVLLKNKKNFFQTLIVLQEKQ